MGLFRRQVYRGLMWENVKEGEHLEEQGVDGRIILKIILKVASVNSDCNNLAQDR